MAVGTTTALLATAAATAGGAMISSNASNNAARTQQAGTDAAVAEQRRQFDQMMQLLMPSYNRSNYAANIYMQALGIPMPSNTGGGGSPAPGGQTSGGGYGGGGISQGGYNSGGGGLIQQLFNTATPGNNQTGLPSNLFQDDAVLMAGAPDGIGQPLVAGGGGDGYTATGTGTGTMPASMTQQGIYDMVQQTPGYQAQLQQGMTAIDRASPLRGGMYSGRRMKALNDYGQNTFGAYYGDWLNRVGGLAGQAPTIGAQIGQAGMQSANNVGNLMMTGANARAQGQLNSASAWSGALGNGIGMLAGSQGWF